MKKYFFLFCLLLACNTPQELQQKQTSRIDPTKPVQTIAFGSCNDQNRDQKMWSSILENQPDLWIWLGDNIYADTRDMKVMKSKYQLQKNHPEYQNFRSQVPIIGIWDDHDYGVNDGDATYPLRAESKQLMFDFLDVAADAPQRKAGRGAYSSYTYGPAGKQVKVILLDARYFREPLQEDKNSDQRYLPNPDGNILGVAQWEWLEKELSQSKAQVHVIGGGIQFIPEEHNWEKMGQFPESPPALFRSISANPTG